MKQHQSDLRQLTLDLGGEVTRASKAFGGLAEDRLEPAVRSPGLLQQVSDATVARNGDPELIMPCGIATLLRWCSAGPNVVEMRDYFRMSSKGLFADLELAAENQARVIDGCAATKPRHLHDWPAAAACSAHWVMAFPPTCLGAGVRRTIAVPP